jgi:hypothetical protein
MWKSSYLPFVKISTLAVCSKQATHLYAPLRKIRLANVWVIKLRTVVVENQYTYCLRKSGYSPCLIRMTIRLRTVWEIKLHAVVVENQAKIRLLSTYLCDSDLSDIDRFMIEICYKNKKENRSVNIKQ